MSIIIKRLESGYWHIRGPGQHDWAQPPQWPCDEDTLRQHSTAEVPDRFIRDVMKLAEKQERGA